MTRLYRPVLIESAEQAEALPVGTVAVDASSQSDVSIRVQGGWHCTGYCLDFGGSEVLKHCDMVGDQALVPIEAEEETVERHRLCQAVPDVLHRYTTPWTLDTPQEDPQ